MAINFPKQKIGLSLVPQNTILPSVLGDIRYNATTNKLELYTGIVDPLVLETAAATLSNKTISAASNTITGLTNANLSGSAGITNANMAEMPAGTIKGNVTGASATPVDLTASQVATLVNLDMPAGTVKANVTASPAPAADVPLSTIASEVASLITAVTTVGTLDSATPSANGLVISGSSIVAQSASVSNAGLVNTGIQSFAGTKDFTTQARTPSVQVYNGSRVTTITRPSTGTDDTWVLPADLGGQDAYLRADGAGNLSWDYPTYLKRTVITGSYTATLQDDIIFLGGGSGGTLTLPASAVTAGKKYIVINYTGFNWLITPSVAFADGGTYRTNTIYDVIEIVCTTFGIYATNAKVNYTLSYYGGNGGNVAPDGIINFPTLTTDPLSRVSSPTTSWRFTAAIPGTYSFQGQIYQSTSSIQTAAYLSINGVSTSAGSNYHFYGQVAASCPIVANVRLAAGDYVQFRALINTQNFVNSTAKLQYMTVARIGN